MKRLTKISDEIIELAELCKKNDPIDPELYKKYDVKRGLRDINGKGVVTGLTEISEIRAYKKVDGKEVPCEGKLYYRGYDIEDIIKGLNGRRYGFEETAYLLIFGELPNEEQLKGFLKILSEYRELPTSFVRDIILRFWRCLWINIMKK